MNDTTSKEKIKNLIDAIGIHDAKKILGMKTTDIVNFTKMNINSELAYDIFYELFSENKLPKIYHEFELYFNIMEGILQWECTNKDIFSNKKYVEKMLIYATPFWDGENDVPIVMSYYEVLDEKTNESIIVFEDDFVESIKIDKTFKDIEELLIWIRDFYLPEVYNVIIKYRNEYRKNI
jgi:hypothetical protein